MAQPITAVNARIGFAPITDTAGPSYGPEEALSNCGSWSLSLTAEQKEYRTCSTSGVKRRIYGGADSSGTLNFLLDPDDPIYAKLREGRQGVLYLYEQDAHITPGITPRRWVVPAFISGLDEDADIDGGEFIPVVINFVGDGPVEDPDGGLPGPTI